MYDSSFVTHSLIINIYGNILFDLFNNKGYIFLIFCSLPLSVSYGTPWIGYKIVL